MAFHSILFRKTEDRIKTAPAKEPVFFVDLNLDQIIDAIVAGKQEYNLKPFFTFRWTILRRLITVRK
jgi:DNA mismatch repair protein MutS